MKQRTLAQSVQFSGIGIHKGEEVQLTLHPADIDTGIVFRRIDLQPVVSIPAKTDYVSDTRMNTCLASEGIAIATVEHVLSALYGLGVDNAYVDLNAAEPPVGDGSSEPFVELILKAGIQNQNASKQFFRIKRKVSVQEEDKIASVEPYSGFKFSLSIDFDHPIIKKTQQTATIDLATICYAKEISRARTFGFYAEYDYLKKNNLARGASLDNTLVLDQDKILNTGNLRYPDEFVKHKVLDAIGDLYLLGHTVIGAFTGYKSGHRLNHLLRQALLADPTAWELVTLQPTDKLPKSYFLVDDKMKSHLQESA